MTYHWDFFGPRAEGTAEHFKIHLDQFLAGKGISGCETGTGSKGAGHCEVFCTLGKDTGEEGGAMIKQLLRPKRETEA